MQSSGITTFRQMQDHFDRFHPQCPSIFEPNYAAVPRIVQDAFFQDGSYFEGNYSDKTDSFNDTNGITVNNSLVSDGKKTNCTSGDLLDMKQIKCHECDRIFSRKDNLKNHLLRQ